MATVLETIQNELACLTLDDALLALNHILAVSRGESSDVAFEPILLARSARPPAFVFHFFAKQLLLHSSNLCPRPLTPWRFHRLMDLYFQLDDPICSDPDWQNADPTGFFERMLAQQLPSQRHINLQPYGLGLGLYRDVGTVLTSRGSYDIRREIESELRMSVEEFMALGMLCSAAPEATHNGQVCRGTFRHMYLAEANIQGLTFSQPELWSPFLSRVACDRDTFRRVCVDPRYQVRDVRFAQFEFNPLRRFPAIDVGEGRHVVVDPRLLVERTTLGLFYDLFERGGLAFSDQFGYVFDRFVGNLLVSQCPATSLWWDGDTNEPKLKMHSKVADWAYRGENDTILFECKSLRPSLELVTYGSEETINKTRKRIVDALEQLIRHAESICAGEWVSHKLHPKPVVGVIVTYGRIWTANGPFMRQRIAQDLAARNLKPIPHVVLSLEELDHVIRLVELGNPLDQVIAKLADAENSFDPLQRYASAFEGQRAISTFSYNRGQQFMNATTTGGIAQRLPAVSAIAG